MTHVKDMACIYYNKGIA